MTNKSVYVILLAWNHIEDTQEALLSFQQDEYLNKNIVLVDNGSSDGTSLIVKNEFKDVEIVRSEVNLGVSGGYNLGIEYAVSQNADYILVANNDIATDRYMISKLVDALEMNLKAGIAMPKIYHYYGDRTRLWCTGAHWRKFPPTVKMTDFNRPDRDMGEEPFPIEYAPSCVLLITKRLIEEVGKFDTSYFFYFDDWDYSKRARQAGFNILFVPGAKMW
ncbi:MAG: glycosyltransferase family 2 protein, partial [Bellilinea sp.]